MNIGAHDGLIDKKHVDAMGSAVWLFLWCIARQTKKTGLVLGGMPLTLDYISEHTGGVAPSTLRRWLRTLRNVGYLGVEYLNFKKLRITVLNPKKFDFKQSRFSFNQSSNIGLGLSSKNGLTVRPELDGTPSRIGRSKQSGSMKHIESKEKNTAADAAAFVLPLWVPVDAWNGYEDMRRRIRRPMTDRARRIALKTLERLQTEGYTPTVVLEWSIFNSYQGLFPPNENHGRSKERFNSEINIGQGPVVDITDEQRQRNRERIERKRKERLQ